MSFRTMGGLLRIVTKNVFPFGVTMENHAYYHPPLSQYIIISGNSHVPPLK